jgi:hypothetical protein
MGISAVQTLQSTGPAPANAEAALARSANMPDEIPSDGQNEKEEADLTFDDLIDVINPLHHLPIVSTIYRAITGDQISVHARAMGGGLYGGPIGLLAAGATMAVEEATGMSASNTLASLFSGEDNDAELAAAPQPRGLTPSDQLMAAPREAAPQAAASLNPAVAQASLPFTAKGGPKFFAIENPQRPQPIPLPSRASAAPAQPANTDAASTAAATAAANGLALTKTEGDLLDSFIRRNGQPQASSQNEARQPAPAATPRSVQALGPPQNAGPAWFANQMEANLEKYAAAQANGLPGR